MNSTTRWIKKLRNELKADTECPLHSNFMSIRSQLAKYDINKQLLRNNEEFVDELITVFTHFGCYEQLWKLSIMVTTSTSKYQIYGALEKFKLTQASLQKDLHNP